MSWVDVSKGDDVNPNIRSRLVARQIRQAGEKAIFAPTPRLEALRSILSMAATDLPRRPVHRIQGAFRPSQLLGRRPHQLAVQCQGGLPLHERAAGDVRGRYETHGHVPFGAPEARVDVSLPEG